MFPSSSGHGVLHSYSDEYLPEDACLSSSRTHPFASFLHFSPAIDQADPFLHHETDLLGSHFHQTIFSPNANLSGLGDGVINMVDSTETADKDMSATGTEMNFFSRNNSSPLGAGRKRGMKKDRHSKILTAQGPRDRRMRLSLEVASKFFNLQNMLGFDTGSKTVGWLLSKSEAAIRELYLATSQTKGCNCRSGKSICSPSEGEVVSGIDEIADNVDPQDSEQRSLAGMSKAKKVRNSKRTTFHPLAKEWRAMARARARERTREKMMSRNDKSKKWFDGYHGAKPFSPLQTGKDSYSRGIHEKKSPFELVAEGKKLSSHAPEHRGSKSHPKTFKLGNLCFKGMSSAQAVNSNDLVSFQNNDMISIFREHWNIDNARTNSVNDATTNIHSVSYAQEHVTNPLLEMTVGSRLPSQFSNI